MLLVRLVDEWASFLPAATFDGFRADLGLTYRAASVALLAIGPGALLGAAITTLADTRSRRVLATLGALVYSAALALFAASATVWMAIAGGFAVGLGSTLLVDTVEVALSDLCSDERTLERALAHVNVAAGIGDLSGPLLVAGTAALGWSWRVPLWITASATAAYAVLVACTPLPRPQPMAAVPATVGALDPPGRGVRLLRRADVWWAGACGAVLVALDEAFVAYVIAYLHDDEHVSTATATAITAALVVGGLVVAAALARRPEPNRPTGVTGRLRASAAVMLAAALVLGVWPAPFVVACSGFALGGATIAFWIPLQTATLRLVPDRSATVVAIVGSIEMAGLAVTPIIGAIADTWGLRTGLYAYCILPAVLVLLASCAPSVGTRPEGR